MDPLEQKALSDIEKYGCHVIHVMEEGDLPPFAYSVGIEKTSGAPELVVVGLKRAMAHFVINEYNRRVLDGASFPAGAVASGFFEGFDSHFRSVDKSHFRAYFGWNRWLYQGDKFRVLQLVYPTVEGIWPWDPDANPWFRARQPLLDSPAG